MVSWPEPRPEPSRSSKFLFFPIFYSFRSYNYKNKRRNGYSPNNRQSKFLGNSSTRSSTPNNFGDNNNSNSIIINPNNDKRGTFGASSRQRKKASTAQANKEGKGGDAGKEIQEKKGKQVINEKEDVLKKLREWTTRSALLSYTASEDEYDDTTEDDGKTEIKLNESDKVENWRDRSKVVKEKEGEFEVMLGMTPRASSGRNRGQYLEMHGAVAMI
ncbi:unnamed protein product [Meloidogyne enterolobii]|uniref:Uncharacterized protein n=1 Tax=Meloidogyne enterolobii TaxID=390850 RepID=A0ACB1A6E7_MELEN